MKKSLFLIFLSVALAFNLVAQPCEFQVRLFDSLGDTWNGAALVFKYDNNSDTLSLEDFGLEELTESIVFPNNVEVTVEFIGGSFDNEVSYEVYDNLGQLIFSDGPGPLIGDVLTFTACGCQITTPEVVYFDHREIWLEWNTLSNSNQQQIIEYGERDFMPGSGTVRTTTDSMIMIVGLDVFTEYDIYITSICLPEMDSTTIGPIQLRTRRATDGGIRDIEPLESGCNLDPIEFGFNIINFGGNPLTLVPVFYSINDRLQQVDMPRDGLYTGLLGPDSVDYFFFDNRYTFPEPGDYKISVWTEIENDTTPFNDTANFTITNSPIIDAYPYFESFEDWSGGWYPDTVIQEHSIWERAGALQGTIPFDGPTVWRIREDVDRVNDVVGSLLSPCFDFSSLSVDPLVKMALYSDDFTDDDHILLFEYTVDDGETWVRPEASPVAQNWYSRAGGIVWNSPLSPMNWSEAENIVDGLAGEGNVQFRLTYFRSGSDFFDTGDGWQMDAFEIIPREAMDLAITAMDLNEINTCASEELSLDVRVRNLGESTADAFTIVITQDGGNPVEFPFSFPLAANADTILTFVLPAGTTNISNLDIRLEFDGDQNVNNNIDAIEIEIYPILDVPFALEFEFDELQGWDLDSSENIIFDFDQFFVESKTLDPGESWNITTPSFGPIDVENELQLEINWTNEDLEYVSLGDQDSICVFISSDCFETTDLLAAFTADNYDPLVDGPLVEVDLSGFEGMTVNFIISFKNNGMNTIVGSINQFNIRSCHQFGFQEQIAYNSHPDSMDSEIIVQAENGNPPYSYEWDNGIAGPVNSNLSDGDYTVTITDSYGCEIIQDFNVRTCPENLSIAFDIIEDEGGLFNNGSIRIISIQGDLSDYSVEWSNGFYDVDRIENLGPERYSLTITNAFGCEYNFVFDFTTTNTTEEGGSDSSLEGITCYPNPSTDFVYLDFGSLNINGDTEVVLMDFMGRIYQQKSITTNLGGSRELKMGPLNKGINFLVVKTNQESKAFKIIGIE